MSSTDRQNRLLVAEDWKRIYQSYRNADFKSYDFDNLRRTMINYLRQNYPEDFNDYIESSEYLALIDMIAFLGQNIAFRTDLNARENFLELAERRESVLRLARTLSYNPKRNQSANGLLKIESVSTTETVRDSNGINLENQTIIWNDPSNANWQEQFTKILNASLPVNNPIGRPVKKDTVNNIPTEQYRFSSTNTGVPVFGFNKSISGSTSRFEIVSTDVNNGAIEEEAPYPGNNFAFLYRNDGKGPSSTNSGYFCHFRQGALDSGSFIVDAPSSPGHFPRLVEVSRTARRISGALDPKAIRVRLATVPFHLKSFCCLSLPSLSTMLMTTFSDVIFSMASMKISATIPIPMKR